MAFNAPLEGAEFELPQHDDPILHEEHLEFKVPYDLTEFASRSKTQKVGDYDIGILIHPKSSRSHFSSSIFFEIVNPTFLPVFCNFNLYIKGTPGETGYAFQKRFSGISDAQTWGRPNFIDRLDLEDINNGYLTDGMLTVYVHLQITQGGSLALYGDDADYDSKAATGMVGLANQGATCYMNSLLQTLFHTNEFRRAVFQIPTADHDSETGVALALQRVFYRLQTKDTEVETTELTKSFGWTSLDAFMQHDVQEFSRVLMDNIEEKMKGTPVEGMVEHLFRGVYKSYIRCLHVDYESARDEHYYDVQLNVKGQKDLISSFRNYIEVDKLEGDNAYASPDNGKQDAEKGEIFKTFPPVLHLQLKRFEYSIELNDFYKVNDRFEFPEKLDLNEFLDAPEDTPAEYSLHSVLVHSGSMHGGHYVAYIRPDCKGQWYKFDDQTVTKVDTDDALEGNFGKDMSIYHRMSVETAYMLVYMRDSFPKLVEPCTDDDIPVPLVERFQKEDAEIEDQLEQARRKRDSTKLKVYTTDQMMSYKNSPNLFKLAVNCASISWAFNKGTIGEWSKTLAKASPPIQPLEPIVAWEVARDYHLGQNLALSLDETVETHPFPRTGKHCRIFVATQPHLIDAADELLDGLTSPGRLYFISVFDPAAESLTFRGTITANVSACLESLLPELKEKLGIDPAADVAVLRKLVSQTGRGVAALEPINPNISFEEQSLDNGADIVLELPAKDGARFTSTEELLAYTTAEVEVEFSAFGSTTTGNLTVPVHPTDTVASVLTKLGEAAGTDQDHVRFVYYRPRAGYYYMNCKDEMETAMFDFCSSFNTSVSSLSYEKCKFPRLEYETKHLATVTWLAEDLKSTVIQFFTEHGSTFQDVVDEACRQQEAEDLKPRIKFFKLHASVISEVNPEDELTDSTKLTIQVLPEEALQEGVSLVSVCHIDKWAYHKWGQPFFSFLKPGDTCAELKARLRPLVGATEKQMQAWSLGHMTKYRRSYTYAALDHFEALDDDEEVTAPTVALDHPKPRVSYLKETALKIHN
eukprot:m.353928 g.353928  ORF g.353928 m.353928 type:complete len:1036 (-) comp16867_c0_seq1:205-3312(-)